MPIWGPDRTPIDTLPSGKASWLSGSTPATLENRARCRKYEPASGTHAPEARQRLRTFGERKKRRRIKAFGE